MIGTFDHPIRAAVAYALHPAVISAADSMRHVPTPAAPKKAKTPRCNKDERCEKGPDHAGECSFPHHERYTSADGKEWAILLSDNQSGYAGVRKVTNEPQGKKRCAAGEQKHWYAQHVGCSQLGCKEKIGSYLAGAPTCKEAALKLAEHQVRSPLLTP
jgi:hypothetical protein